MHLCQVLFPAQERFQNWVGGHEVVRVHDCVNGRVDKREKARVAAGCKLEKEPGCCRNARVVENVERGYLGVFLAEREENSVCKLDEPRGEEDPAVVDLVERALVALMKINWPTADAVEPVVGQLEARVTAKGVPEQHAEIVSPNERKNFNCLPVAHHLGPN